ncbi:hypothetical protein JCGZ_10820 [Jatropha curcas]|uniref:Uncharacterized protein n=1 Tax=Jatropha curcas TaxID=180498 RepID=A0A067KH42_JATCU|nr:hypothetical protein JCGZ_10820 [Jatropha curcas]
MHGGRKIKSCPEICDSHTKMLEIMPGPRLYDQFELKIVGKPTGGAICGGARNCDSSCSRCACQKQRRREEKGGLNSCAGDATVQRLSRSAPVAGMGRKGGGGRCSRWRQEGEEEKEKKGNKERKKILELLDHSSSIRTGLV